MCIVGVSLLGFTIDRSWRVDGGVRFFCGGSSTCVVNVVLVVGVDSILGRLWGVLVGYICVGCVIH